MRESPRQFGSGGSAVDKKAKTPKKPKQNKAKGADKPK
jgi:hypothetical protein